jgi:hypothetical protein
MTSCETIDDSCPGELSVLVLVGSFLTTASGKSAPAKTRAICMSGLSGDEDCGGDREDEQLLELDSPSDRE